MLSMVESADERKRRRARPELLAPAGGPEAGYAALAYGADAVYLGLRRFSARAEAVNFSLDDLGALAAHAHALSPPRRVFAAVNTLVRCGEVGEAVDTLAAARDFGADAVIVQDLGIARIARAHFPGLEMHASTQLAVHDLAGAEALARAGFSRVTLARELTIREISAICRSAPVEIEVFVHGALCYSYSGLCAFSAFTTGRSANRGSCAQPCRCLYRTDSGPRSGRYLFSMKDLALPRHVRALSDAGVSCLKIEGRMKGPLYSAAASDFYRRIIDGSDPDRMEQDAEDLRTTFSRPWTSLYADARGWRGAVDTDFAGHRGACIGEVSSSRQGRKGGIWAAFKTSRPIERRDGLQIEFPGPQKPLGFSIVAMRSAGGGPLLNEADAGSEIEVLLPDDAPSVPAGSKVFCSSSQAVKRRFRWTVPAKGAPGPSAAADFRIAVSPGLAEVRACAALPNSGPAAHAEARIEGGFPPARDPAGVERFVKEAFGRLGGTRFSQGAVETENPQGLFVPLSALNDLRRKAVLALDEALEASRGAEKARVISAIGLDCPSRPSTRGASAESWSLKVDDAGILEAFGKGDLEAADEIVLYLAARGCADAARSASGLASRAGAGRIRMALPPVIREWDLPQLEEALARLSADGFSKFEVAGVGGFGIVARIASRFGCRPDVRSDWPVYVWNRSAAAAVLSMGASGFTLSPEDTAENMELLLGEFGPLAAVVVLSRPPLFLSETCAFASASGSCPGPGDCRARYTGLSSDFGDDLVMINLGCRTAVVKRGFHDISPLLPRLRAAGASSFRVDLQHSLGGPEEALAAWKAARKA